MMGRFLFAVLLVTGCAPHAASGPAWPKERVTDDDGGESLAPRHPDRLATAGDGDDAGNAATPDATAADGGSDADGSADAASDDTSDDDDASASDDTSDDATPEGAIVIDGDDDVDGD